MSETSFWIGMLLLTGAFLVTLVTWVAYISGPAIGRRKLARLAGRPEISTSEQYRRFYWDTGLSEATVVGILNQIAGASQIPAGLLRPRDRFTVELGRVSVAEIDEAATELRLLLGQAEEDAGLTVDYRKIATVGDYVWVLGCLREKRTVSNELRWQSGWPVRAYLAARLAAWIGCFTLLLWVLPRLGLEAYAAWLVTGFALAMVIWSRYELRRFQFGRTRPLR